eukprot:3168933-Pyramimonas_sp.AAC.1
MAKRAPAMLQPLANARLSLKKGERPTPPDCVVLHHQVLAYENTPTCNTRFAPLHIVEHADLAKERPTTYTLPLLRAGFIARSVKTEFGIGAGAAMKLLVNCEDLAEVDHGGSAYLWAHAFRSTLYSVCGDIQAHN